MGTFNRADVHRLVLQIEHDLIAQCAPDHIVYPIVAPVLSVHSSVSMFTKKIRKPGTTRALARSTAMSK
jgi:hypothetical protein